MRPFSQHHPFSHAALAHTTCRASFLSTGTHLCLVSSLRPDPVSTMAPTMAMRRLLSTPAVSFPPTLCPRLSPAIRAPRLARLESCDVPPFQQHTANTRPRTGVPPGKKPIEGILFHSSSWYVFPYYSPPRSSDLPKLIGSSTAKIFANRPLRAQEASPFVSTKYPVIVRPNDNSCYTFLPMYASANLETDKGPRVRCCRRRCRWLRPASCLWSRRGRFQHRMYIEAFPHEKSHRRRTRWYQRSPGKHARG